MKAILKLEVARQENLKHQLVLLNFKKPDAINILLHLLVKIDEQRSALKSKNVDKVWSFILLRKLLDFYHLV